MRTEQYGNYQCVTKEEEYDFVVCGGGLAGFCAAMSAARNNLKVCLVQDRPVLGGNSSSEIRVNPLGASRFHAFAKESGLLMEVIAKERAINHSEAFGDNGWMNSLWDMVLYDMAVKEPNLTLYLNTTFVEVVMAEKNEISGVICQVANAEVRLLLKAKIFADCTGDGLVAAKAGCEWRMGEEAREEFNEPHAPRQGSDNTMGSSIHFSAKDMGRPVPFEAPDWAIKDFDEDFFYKQGRIPYNPKGGFWWIEIGTPWHTIYQNEEIRHELTKYTLGIWDWIKNKDPHLKQQAENYALDWIGQVPGKRESRRIMGMYLMTEKDLISKTVFPDEVAYGGFYIDLHTIGGLLAEHSEPSHALSDQQKLDATIDGVDEKSDYAISTYIAPYGIPLRALISKDIKNLVMAGRNISTTHVALGTLRVMSTTALMGEAIGTAAATAVKNQVTIQEVPEKYMDEVQQALLKAGCFLLNHKNEDKNDKAKIAKVTAGSSKLLKGVGPQTKDWHSDTFMLNNKPMTSAPVTLKDRVGQLIATSKEGIKSISVCLSNTTSKVQEIDARILQVQHIWDYDNNKGYKPSWEGVLRILPGKLQWIEIPFHLNGCDVVSENQMIRLDVGPNAFVEWEMSPTVETGQMAVYEMATGRMRKLQEGRSMSFRIDPPQKVYEPENVLSGRTRPYEATNLWKSDPSRSLPEWLQLEWTDLQEIHEIQLTFPGHLTYEYRMYPPFFKDPEIAKDYSVFAWIEQEWQEVLEVKGNYEYRKCHRLNQSITTSKLKIVIYSTNGDLSAGLYEIRCY